MQNALRVALVLCLALPAAADVLRVGPAQPYSEVADAVAAAVDGDLILIASGTYAGFTVDDKALWIAAHPGAHVVVGEVAVDDLAAGKSLRLTGFSDQRKGLSLTNCTGSVRVHE
ncbi:MAG: hypothetical protein GY711_19090 [bacterium]|nr:hypothetical protein [bacterium]